MNATQGGHHGAGDHVARILILNLGQKRDCLRARLAQVVVAITANARGIEILEAFRQAGDERSEGGARIRRQRA